jgi:hypothetical protein
MLLMMASQSDGAFGHIIGTYLFKVADEVKPSRMMPLQPMMQK